MQRLVVAVALGALAWCAPTQDIVAQSAVPIAERVQSRELVVVVHGMGRTSRSMRPMALALEEAGYDVVNIGYSSLCCTIAELGAAVLRELETQRQPRHEVVHFVSHSLGGIIVRWILTQGSKPAGIGRAVMLAPPNQGSRSADRYTPLIGWLLEPIDELRTDSTATVRTMPRVVGVPIGVISGRQDGKLTYEDSHLDEAAAHVVVDGYHTFLMRRHEVHRLTIGFLRTGRFDPPMLATP